MLEELHHDDLNAVKSKSEEVADNVETMELEENIVKETREALDPLRQDIEYRGLEGKFYQMYMFAKQLDAQYQGILKNNPDLAQIQRTRVLVEWSVFSIYDAEYHSSYSLKLYWWYDPLENNLKEPWTLPELILFDENWARTTHKLDPAQYKEMSEKIIDILNREADQISKLINGN